MINTEQYKDNRGLYNMTLEQVEAADYNDLYAICCYCNYQGGWTLGTKNLIVKEISRRQKEKIRSLIQSKRSIT